MRDKNNLKRNRLIEKLFNRIIKDNKINVTSIPLKFEIDNGRGNSACKTRYNESDEVISQRIRFDLDSITDRIKFGYDDSHYEGRAEKVNHLIKNRHTAIRFVLLHEIKHSIDRRASGTYINYESIRTEKRESDCDDFAIDNLKRY